MRQTLLKASIQINSINSYNNPEVVTITITTLILFTEKKTKAQSQILFIALHCRPI